MPLLRSEGSLQFTTACADLDRTRRGVRGNERGASRRAWLHRVDGAGETEVGPDLHPLGASVGNR